MEIGTKRQVVNGNRETTWVDIFQGFVFMEDTEIYTGEKYM